jgi:hypothetical protein
LGDSLIADCLVIADCRMCDRLAESAIDEFAQQSSNQGIGNRRVI